MYIKKNIRSIYFKPSAHKFKCDLLLLKNETFFLPYLKLIILDMISPEIYTFWSYTVGTCWKLPITPMCPWCAPPVSWGSISEVLTLSSSISKIQTWFHSISIPSNGLTLRKKKRPNQVKKGALFISFLSFLSVLFLFYFFLLGNR